MNTTSPTCASRGTKPVVKQEKTSLRRRVEKEIEYNEGIKPEFKGTEDAPHGVVIEVPLSRCNANPNDPFGCIIANQLLLNKHNIKLPPHLGRVVDVAINADRAYVAVRVPRTNEFKILKFNHDGGWVVKAFDSQDPGELAKMWVTIDAGNAVITLKRFRDSQTTEGRKKAARVRAAMIEMGLMDPVEKKSVPQRGFRPNGINPRRQYADQHVR